MQVSLGPTTYEAILPWVDDFKKKAKNHENLPSHAELLGIFCESSLAGYFIVTGYDDGDLEINHGYLHKSFRHKDLSKLAMQLLEQKAKNRGFKQVILASSRTLKSYTKFMDGLGYKPSRIVFRKEL